MSGRSITTIATGTTVILSGAGATFAALNLLTTNNGALSILGGNSFTPGATTLSNTGTLTVDTGGILHAGVNVSSGGKLTEAGTITGPVAIVTGTLAPGGVSSPGTMTVSNS